MLELAPVDIVQLATSGAIDEAAKRDKVTHGQEIYERLCYGQSRYSHSRELQDA